MADSLLALLLALALVLPLPTPLPDDDLHSPLADWTPREW